jgi:HK97 family phage major capsid protein
MLIPATLDMMVSSAFDLEKEIAADVGESFAQGEGNNFVKGSGRKGPQGITQDSRVVSYTTASSGTVVWADFATMSGKLKRGYNPWWLMNRRSLAYLQGLQSSMAAGSGEPAGDRVGLPL